MYKANKARVICGAITLAALLGAANYASATTTVAYDTAANYAETGFTGNQGFGFGAWTLNTIGGGSYISTDDSGHPYAFALWNGQANSTSTAQRAFDAPLTAGETFSLQNKLIYMDNETMLNGFNLQDSSGDTLFSFYHAGGDDNDGHYVDASGNGTASGFSYNFRGFNSYTFTLDSATSYTFSDLNTGANFTGTLNGTIDQITFFRTNEGGQPSNGQDFMFDNLMVTEVPEPSAIALLGSGLGLLFLARRSRSIPA